MEDALLLASCSLGMAHGEPRAGSSAGVVTFPATPIPSDQGMTGAYMLMPRVAATARSRSLASSPRAVVKAVASACRVAGREASQVKSRGLEEGEVLLLLLLLLLLLPPPAAVTR